MGCGVGGSCPLPTVETQTIKYTCGLHQDGSGRIDCATCKRPTSHALIHRIDHSFTKEGRSADCTCPGFNTQCLAGHRFISHRLG